MEKKTKLTKSVVDALGPRRVRYEVWDHELKGFGVRVGTGGDKTFVFKYYRDGARKTFTIGRYDEALTPDKARKEAVKHKGAVLSGKDPMGERKEKRREVKAEREAATVESVGRRFIEEVKPRQRRWKESERVLQRYIYPALGPRKIAEVRRSDVRALLDQLKGTTGPVMAHRAFMQLRRVMNWHAANTDDFASPILPGMDEFAWTDVERDRELTDDEIRILWRALDMCEPPFRQVVRFLLLSAQRRNECVKARDTELKGNAWTIPPERFKKTKKEREHVVPLSAFALEQLQEAIAADPTDDRGPRGAYVFSTRRGHAAFNGFSKAKARLDAEMVRIMRETNPEAELKPWRLHDLRRTARTLMARAGVPSVHAERVLGHVVGSRVEETYDRFAYLAEKRIALETLATAVEAILHPEIFAGIDALAHSIKSTSNVVRLRKQA